MTSSSVRYIGAQVDKEIHKMIKMRCAELGIDLKVAIIEGLMQRLGLPVPEEGSNEKQEAV